LLLTIIELLALLDPVLLWVDCKLLNGNYPTFFSGERVLSLFYLYSFIYYYYYYENAKYGSILLLFIYILLVCFIYDSFIYWLIICIACTLSFACILSVLLGLALYLLVDVLGTNTLYLWWLEIITLWDVFN
jgi:hypothetical protein